ncbi:MAG: hypothetical protein AAGD14_09790, partial [Planctomycetota bacterium]
AVAIAVTVTVARDPLAPLEGLDAITVAGYTVSNFVVATVLDRFVAGDVVARDAAGHVVGTAHEDTDAATTGITLPAVLGGDADALVALRDPHLVGDPLGAARHPDALGVNVTVTMRTVPAAIAVRTAIAFTETDTDANATVAVVAEPESDLEIAGVGRRCHSYERSGEDE